MKIHKITKNFVILTCFLVVLVGFPKTKVSGFDGGVSPNVIRCVERLGVYSETVSQPWKWTQFNFIVYPSSTVTNVTRTMTMSITLGIDTGVSADFNILMVKTQVHFNLSSAATTTETVSVTWDVPPSTQNTYLAAGELKKKVTGTITDTFVDCSVEKRTIAATGTLYAFSESHY